MQTINLF